MFMSHKVWAHPCTIPYHICSREDCDETTSGIIANHAIGEAQMTTHITQQFGLYRDWLLNTFFIDNLLPAMMMMTEQLSAVGMHQMLAVGAIMDAKTQLETQRLFQEMRLETLSRYQPSQDFCYFGTNVRSLSHAESRYKAAHKALNAYGMARNLGRYNNAAAPSQNSDMLARFRNYAVTNCNPYNNNYNPNAAGISGLTNVCDVGGFVTNQGRANIDVSFSRLVDEQRTINLDLTDTAAEPYPIDPPEEDVFALSKNLYGHKVPVRDVGFLDRISGQHLYLDLRSVVAKRNVAQNSFNHIAGMKAKHENGESAEYIRALLFNLGVDDADPENYQALLGDDPSYYAQLEALSKRIYQDSSFYANLYDKPENVERKGVAIRAIELMLDRARFESRLRQEMLVSVLLSTKLEKAQDAVSDQLESSIKFEEMDN